MFALIDCNNFFVSAERIFRPDLNDVPVIVLSNNDGCVISRSNEAKALGIQMGEPFFKIQKFCKLHDVRVFSSNFTLYADISDRIMNIVQNYWDACEIYSIDELFLDLKSLTTDKVLEFCQDLQQKILQYTAIPTSIGIGQTKTLAKAANLIGKKRLKVAVFDITANKDYWLKNIAIHEVWGIGKQWSRKLNSLGIKTAYDFAYMHFSAKQSLNVVVKRVSLELMGKTCFELEQPQAKQSIVSSRSFASLKQEKKFLQESVSQHCATAWRKLRSQNLMVGHISVFIYSNVFRADLKQYSNSIGFRLSSPTDDICYLTNIAKDAVEKIFKSGIHYKRSGVMFSNLIDKNSKQMDLFNVDDTAKTTRNEQFMQVLEDINNKFGPHTVKLLSQGLDKKCLGKRELKSPCYTTSWSELPIVRI